MTATSSETAISITERNVPRRSTDEDVPEAEPASEGVTNGVSFDSDGAEDGDGEDDLVVPPPRLRRWSSRRRPLADVCSGVDPDGPHGGRIGDRRGDGVNEAGDGAGATSPPALACTTTAWSDGEGVSDDGSSDDGDDVDLGVPVGCDEAPPTGDGEGSKSDQQVRDDCPEEMPGSGPRRGHDQASRATGTNGEDGDDGQDGENDENCQAAKSRSSMSQHDPRVVDASSLSHSLTQTPKDSDGTVVKSKLSSPTADRGGDGGVARTPPCCGCLAPYARPLLCLLLLYALFITGAMSYLIRRFLPVPGLSGQLDRLERQNRALRDELDDLERQRRRLNEEIDRFRDEKVRLALETKQFAAHNVELNSSNAEYETLNGELNSTLADLGRVQNELDSTNAQHRLRHDLLTETNGERLILHSSLSNATDRLTARKRSMEAANDELRDILNIALSFHDGLSARRDSYEEEGRRLNVTIIDLRGRAAALPGENALYEELNANLTTVTSFWRRVGGESAGGGGGGSRGVDASFRGLSSLLDTSIETSTTTAVEDLHLGMERTVDGWRCHLSDAFDPDSSPFVSDQTAPIGGVESYRTALRLIDNVALSKLCGDVDDFEMYLAGEFPSSPGANLSLDQLASGLKLYSVEVIDHYFPDEGEEEEGGITEEEWADAGFDCRNLPVERRFSRFFNGTR